MAAYSDPLSGPKRYRSAILAHVAANPRKTSVQVRAWAEDELGLPTTKAGFHDFDRG
jgi:hypothetical protein